MWRRNKHQEQEFIHLFILCQVSDPLPELKELSEDVRWVRFILREEKVKPTRQRVTGRFPTRCCWFGSSATKSSETTHKFLKLHQMDRGEDLELEAEEEMEEMEEMSAARKELREVLCRYVTGTLVDVDTVTGFCEKLSKWLLWRETELNMMMDVKVRADAVELGIGHVTRSENRGKALWEYLRSKVTQVTAHSRRAALEEELAAVLKDTLGGLEKLDRFLDAVEKLAVTSLHVFTENQATRLSESIRLGRVRDAIAAARLVCPLLLEFRRDAGAFFLPRLHNVEVLAYELDKYLRTTQTICETLMKSSLSDVHLKTTVETAVKLDVDLSEDDVRMMLDHIHQLDEIRTNQHFRTVFLFQEESCCGFITEFSERRPGMLQFLSDMEESAVRLDRMHLGAKISSVAGSSVGAVGGVLSIVGLALIPVTLGASAALMLTGVGLGVTSGVNSAVTTATEIGVNNTQQNKASQALQSFMKDVQSLQDCLDKVTSQTVSKMENSVIDTTLGVSNVLVKAGVIGKGIDAIVDLASAPKFLQSEEVIAGVGMAVAQEGQALRNVPRVASDIPDIGQAVAKGPLAFSRSARAGFITLNALFLGMDIFFICKDSISLAKGSKNEVSQLIKARAALWSSEMDSWQKIHDSLSQGLETSEKKRITLETPFYPEMQREADTEVPACEA
uniref:Apolipoprotein L n=2 Tax=Scophthalmus maximus TaxID=52904 RepID=A0A8D3DGD1_SCOMX